MGGASVKAGLMAMLQTLCMVIVLLGAGTLPCYADGSSEPGKDVTKILVTFSDSGMSNAARAGPARPGYTRRSSSYLVSVGVKRAANRIADDFKLVTIDEWPIISLKVHCLVFGAPNVADIDDLLARLRQRPEVESAQRLNEFEVSASSPSTSADPYAELQHNSITLELTQAHRWSRGAGTSVSIIDTGADFEHPELRARISSHRDFVESGDGEFSADVHGTAVAGVIGAEGDNGVGIIGVAPSTELSVLKACWHRPDRDRAVCNTFTLAKALNYAIESGTDIINLSLNGPSDALLARLVEQALERGIVVVAAAPEDIHSGFPVEITGVIVVGSNDQRDTRDAHTRPLVNAPGADILVPVPRGGYDFASGTSLAAAHVSGIVALLVARQPGLTANEITSLLVNSQLSVTDSVNACRALAELLAETGCVSADSLSQTL
jgi:subtilisin family serine protease